MQVSWIDPEEVAALAESLRPASTRAPARAAAEMPVPETVEPLVKDGPASPAAESASGEGQSSPDMDAFRERLQKIRERAIQAGLMTPRPAVNAAPAQPANPVAPTPDLAEPEPSSPPPSASEPEPVSEAPPAVEAESGEANESPPQAEPEATPPPSSLAAFQPPSFPESAEDVVEMPAPVASFSPAPHSEPEPAWMPAPPVVPMDAGFTEPAHLPSPAPAPMPMMEAGFQLSPDASVKERLEAFASWTAGRGTTGELLIVDEYGDLLWGPPKKSGLVLSTMMAWNAAIRASAQAASGVAQIRQQLLPAGETLTLIPCQSRLGLLQIALVTAQAPLEEDSAAMRQMLLQLMDLGR